MRQAKLRGWGNWAIYQPFKLAQFPNFPSSLSFLHFRSFEFRNALFLCLLSPLSRIRRISLSSTRLFWGLGGLSRHSHFWPCCYGCCNCRFTSSNTLVISIAIRHKTLARRGEIKWLMRQAKLRGWRNWAIYQSFKLAQFFNFFFSLSFLHFRSFVLRSFTFCLQ